MLTSTSPPADSRKNEAWLREQPVTEAIWASLSCSAAGVGVGREWLTVAHWCLRVLTGHPGDCRGGIGWVDGGEGGALARGLLSVAAAAMSANNLLSLPFKATDQVRTPAQPPAASSPHPPLGSLNSQVATLADQVVAHIAATSETTHPDLVRPDAHAWQHLRDRIFAAPTGAVPLLSQATLSDLTACVLPVPAG